MRVLLARHILDKQILDRDGENAGKADGIVLSLRDGKPPLVSYVEVSPITLLSRFNRALARWYARHDRRFGKGRGVPFRIPITRITRDGPSLRMDLDVEATPINAFEDWLRIHIVEKMPGS